MLKLIKLLIQSPFRAKIVVYIPILSAIVFCSYCTWNYSLQELIDKVNGIPSSVEGVMGIILFGFGLVIPALLIEVFVMYLFYAIKMLFQWGIESDSLHSERPSLSRREIMLIEYVIDTFILGESDVDLYIFDDN